MIEGDPSARVVSFFVDGNDPELLPLVGDGLLPADIDGKTKPKQDAHDPDRRHAGRRLPATVPRSTPSTSGSSTSTGTPQSRENASFELATQLPVAEFDSNYPVCARPRATAWRSPGSRTPTSASTSSRTVNDRRGGLRTGRFKDYETMVTSQSVEAAALRVTAGMRWYEIRRVNGTYTLHQQGTYAPSDGVHRWMGSIAQDKNGNMALGYSVVNGTNVYPGHPVHRPPRR